MDLRLVVEIITFFALALGAFAIMDLLSTRERQVQRSLATLSAYEEHEAGEADPSLRSFKERVLAPVGHSLVALVRGVAPSDYREQLHRRLLHAGEPGNLRPESLLMLKGVAVLATLVVLGPIAVFFFVTGSRALSFVLGVMIPLGFFLPDLWLSALATKRARAIRLALPDMLDMLIISVEAGLGLDSALAKLVANTSGPLSDEFGKVLRETQAGVSRRDAFMNLSARVDAAEIGSFISALVQADMFGVSVSHTLRAQAKEMRIRRRLHAEELGQKAPVKLAFPLVICILPATIVVVAGPALLSIARAFGLVAR